MADYFLKIDGIAGESTDAKHKGEIELTSYSWGVSQHVTASPGSGGGGGAGKAAFQDFTFVQHVQVSSPALMLACATGQHLKSATLTVRTTGKAPIEFLTIKLTDVLVSAFQEVTHEGGRPLESVSLDYAKIEIAYRPQGAAGKPGAEVKAGWDLKANKKV
jgi:type VI secretion system secreted protein Hcp